MSAHTRKHLTAWLGLVAMWLIVLAPIVSQVADAAQRQNPAESALCSAARPVARSAPRDHAMHVAACGYCALLSDHAAMPPVAPVLPTRLALADLPLVVARTSWDIPSDAFPSARPRAPPASSHLAI